ncbi:MAG: AraC family transcriptional regulator [Alphaproteobacteria bacterium]|nr:MAG: AraC family transcriptional regulator [Alphaproteobacteria bacterium]
MLIDQVNAGRLHPTEAHRAGQNALRLAAIPTANGAISRKAYARLKEAGIDTRPLLEEAGLTARILQEPNVRFPVKSQITFLNAAARALNDEFLGIELARALELRDFGLLYYVQASSASLGDALTRVTRYSGLHNEGVVLRYTRHENAAISFRYVGVPRAGDYHQIEFFIAALLRACRHLTARNLVPSAVKFVHHRQHVTAEVRALFGCEISFGAAVDQIIFPAASASIPITQADPYLNAILVEYCEEALGERQVKAGPWRLRVENALVPLLPHGKAHLAEVCAELGTSPRTVTRRLASEGQTFSGVLDNLRRALANRYLQERDLPISQIAWLLGYKDNSAFNHSFKRWTQSSPSQVRSSGANTGC